LSRLNARKRSFRIRPGARLADPPGDLWRRFAV
jgi:hypothetical protein